MITAIINGKVIFHDRIEDGTPLILEDGKIIGVGGKLPEHTDCVCDALGRYVSPGFIDLHTHGGGGYDFMDGTAEAVEGACKLHLRHGTTSIVPTTLTCPDEELLHFFEVYRETKRTMKDGPNLLGVHLEGPFFSHAQCGAQDPAYLKAPVPAAYLPLLDAGGDDIIRVSAAPELEGGMELGEELNRRGILAAIGHSDADYPTVKEAVEHGYRHVTHLYSGMSALHRVGPYRVLGVVESAYLLDALSVEIIADGKHLPPELLRLIVKNKNRDQICLITDSMRGAGMEEGQHAILGSLSSGQDVVICDGVAMMPDGKAFAGSICTADRCIRVMHGQAGLTLPEAVAMMTCNPARLLHLEEHKGSIAEGMDADLCIFDEAVDIKAVFVGGKQVVQER